LIRGLKCNNRCVLRHLLSINDNHIWTSCTFYVKLIHIEHSRELGRQHRERARCCGLGREGEKKGVERAWVLNWGQHSLILTDGLNQHKVFLAIANGHINTEIFWDSVNSEISIENIFWIDVCFQHLFWCYIFGSNNTELCHVINVVNNKHC